MELDLKLNPEHGGRMALTRDKYRRIPDLYVVGKELVLLDGTVIWMQALNPLERDEAQHDAQVARARLVMALNSEHGSDELMKVKAAFFADGRKRAVETLINIKLNLKLMEIVTSIRNDPDWKERLDVLDRTTGVTSALPSEAEQNLVADLNTAYVNEIEQRQADERAYLVNDYERASDDDIIADYVDVWIERRGGDVARSEYDLTELWYAARACDGEQREGGEWDHSRCDGHVLRVWETKDEVHSLPETLQDSLNQVMQTLNMTVRDAKNSARQGSSSGSSPLPSEGEGSTPSTPSETHSEPLGISSPQSAMASQ